MSQYATGARRATRPKENLLHHKEVRLRGPPFEYTVSHEPAQRHSYQRREDRVGSCFRLLPLTLIGPSPAKR